MTTLRAGASAAGILLATLAGVALSACGAAEDTGLNYVSLAENPAVCGLETQGRVAWGQAVAGSGLQMQEVTAEPGMLLRVWSEEDSGLTAADGDITGMVRGPAWLAAERRPDAYLLYLADGAAHLRIDAEGIFCAADAPAS
jgi:hypothetical protein